MVLYKIRGLTFSYPECEKHALKNINLEINEGEFITVCGKSGCGKSTLLRHFKSVLTPHGERSGEILFQDTILNEVDLRTQSSKIGYVLQSPDNQIVTDKVWHELAFGLESLGFDNKTIRLRVAEMASFFGIQGWFMKNVTELSGGQKQLLNLAAIMAMQPSVLILDEPTSQLDPIAATEFLETVRKINQEIGTTIIITEHRLEEVFPMSDRVVVLDNGEIIENNTPRNVGEKLKKSNHDMFVSMPSPMQIYAGIECDLSCPLTVREGRSFLNELLTNKEIHEVAYEESFQSKNSEVVVSLKDIWFKYEKNSKDVVKDLSLEVKRGTIHAIVGGNGTGKTTTLNLISGINKPYRGKVVINNKEISKYSNKELFNCNLGVLPQNPQALFVKKTVESDLLEILGGRKISKDEKVEKVKEIAQLLEIDDFLQMHPYDLSGGEQQRAAMAKVLLLNPQILLLDEPTKGMDSCFKNKLAKILKKLTSKGVTILMVSHDIEFCAKYADMCSLFFDGNIVTTNTPRKFFSGNSFYTTSANRMCRHIFKNAIVNEDVIELCKQSLKKVTL
ncbi:ABC transporter ATP-binding protein [Hathewaya histolytica]|uniref:ABC transporter ATP-binding protein n=1 Tax=Hathewaya histolytica TaxID=1498 RepID=UPI003B66C711